MSSIKLYIAVLLLLCSFTAAAGVDTLGRVHFDVHNGLPSNNLYTFLQDRYGYMWFATENGVVKYNGYTFRTFNTNDGMPSPEVWKLTEDRYGRLWANYHSTQLGYFKQDVFKTIDFNLPRIYNTSIFLDKRGIPYFTYGLPSVTTLLSFDSADKISIQKFPGFSGTMLSGDHRFISILQPYNILCEMEFANGKVKAKPFCDTVLAKKMRHDNSNMVITSDNLCLNFKNGENFLSCYDLNNCTTDTISLKSYGAAEEEIIYNFDVIEDKFIVVTQNAVYVLGHGLKLLRRIEVNKLLPGKPQIAYWTVDDIGNEWFATNSVGGYMFPAKFLQLQKDNILNEAGDETYVGSLADGTTCWWSKLKKTIIAISADNKVNYYWTDKIVKRVADYDNNNMLISAPDGLFVCEKENGLLHFIQEGRYIELGPKTVGTYIKPTHSIYTEAIKSNEFYSVINIQQYKNGRFFLSNYGNIKVVDIDTGKILLDVIAFNRYTTSLYDSALNRIVYYNREGFLIVRPDSIKTVEVKKHVLKLLDIDVISSMAVDRYGDLIIAEDKNLVLFNLSTRNIVHVNLNVNFANLKMAVSGDKLILAGKFGLAYANILGSCKLSSFKVAPNVNTNIYDNVKDIVVDNYGKIFVATDNGIFNSTVDDLVHSDKLMDDHDNNFMKITITNPYPKRIFNADTLFFPARTDKITFDCINIYAKGSRYFVYKIEGINDWQKSVSGEALLTDVKPGIGYKVLCYVVDDMWKSKLYAFYIYKQPRWYETLFWVRLFWVGGVMLAGALVAFIILITRYYVNQSNKKKSRLLDLELRAIYSQINPHFIFNTLSSALFFINRRQFTEAYSHVSKFSRLLRSYLKSSQERYISVAEEISMLRNYIELQQIRFEEKLDYTIEVDNKIPADNVKIPSLLLQPLVENAINHGLFHKKGRGTLSLKFLQGTTSDDLIVVIEDNGIGRLKASEINRSNIFKRESYGTQLTRKLIEIFREYEHMNIYLQYTDKLAPDTGTIVTLTIRNVKYDA